MRKFIELLGMPVDVVEANEVVATIGALTQSPAPHLVVTPNVDYFVRWQRSETFRRYYEHATLRLIDGSPILLMARMAGATTAQRTPGSDLMLPCLQWSAAHGCRVAIIGGTESANRQAVDVARSTIPAISIEVTEAPTEDELTSSAYVKLLAERLRGVDMVILCLGSPKQEKLFVDLVSYGVSRGAYLCFGAAVDFLSGSKSRAPRIMQTLGLEWLFRLYSEPRRLWRRYLVDDAPFFLYFFRHAWRCTVGAARARLRSHRSSTSPSTSRLQILMVGPDVEDSGGMASVISEFAKHSTDQVSFNPVSTWRPNRPMSSFFAALHLCVSLLADKSQADVVHSHLSEGGSFVREGLLPGIACRLAGIPFVVTLHGANMSRFFEERPSLARHTLKLAQRIICLGPATKELVENRFELSAKCEIILNPIFVPSMLVLDRVSDGELRLLFVGEVGHRKGFDRFVEAVGCLARSSLGVRVAVRVCGPLSASMSPAELNNFDYRGVVARNDLAAHYLWADVLCLPSRNEVLPMAVLEAVANGTPVVVSACGETESLAHCPAVTVVPQELADNAQGLSRAIEERVRSGFPADSTDWLIHHAEVQSVIRRTAELYCGLIESERSIREN